MYAGTSRPQASVTPQQWQRAKRIFLLMPLAIVLAPVVLIATIIAYIWMMGFIPAHTATMDVPSLRARVTLQFYYIWDPMKDGGRYLTVETPADRVTIAMAYVDWAHNARTNIYLMPDGRIAAVGPMGDDYLVSLTPLAAGPLARVLSDDWSYLGAFDFVHDPALRDYRELRFLNASELPECIPMRSEDTGHADSARNAARQRDCPRQ